MALVKIILLVFAYGVLLNSCVFAFTEPKQDTSLSEEESHYPKNTFYLTLESKCRDRYIDCTEEYCYYINTSRWKRKMRRQCKKTCGFCRTSTHDRLSMILLDTRRLADIKKLSCDGQTSCLEGFHSTLNHWHPKMQHFSWLGTYCRHILAILHFNENLNREKRKTAGGASYYNVVFPKFKLGEEVVREVAIRPTYGYVDEIKNILFTKEKKELQKTIDVYVKKVPESLTSQFTNRRTRTEAIDMQKKRRSMETLLHPPCAFSPPVCFKSQYGCCWDYVTAALGPGGKGCPPCDDSRRYPNVCQRFQTYCRRKGISGKWMRGHCPDACGHCAIWQFK